MNLKNSRIEWICKMQEPVGKRLLRIAAQVIFILFGMISVILIFLPFLILAAVFGVVWYLLYRDRKVEYEFDYMGEELEIFKISNASRRKKKFKCTLEEISYIWKGLDDQKPNKDFYWDPEKAYTMQVNNSEGRTFVRLEVDEKFLQLLEQERKLRK